MKSSAPTVASYIEAQPLEWQPTLNKLRAACVRQLPGYEETIAYGMPSYSHEGKSEVAYAKQAHYLSFYILNKSVLDAHRAELAGLSVGKGCIRYRQPGAIDWEVVAGLLADVFASQDPIC
jgi:uncharacterized protein YdhG (YjbR/CyaY superfamily)